MDTGFRGNDCDVVVKTKELSDFSIDRNLLICYKCVKIINTLIAYFCGKTGEGDTMILLDYRDKRPIYEQVVEKLERLIISGGLEPLTRMPSVRNLALELSVNPNTIQRAYAQLEQDGYLYTVSGRGSFVTAENEWRENKQSKVLKAWQDITRQAKEMGIAREQLAEHLQQIYDTERAGNEGTEQAGKKGTERADAELE